MQMTFFLAAVDSAFACSVMYLQCDFWCCTPCILKSEGEGIAFCSNIARQVKSWSSSNHHLLTSALRCCTAKTGYWQENWNEEDSRKRVFPKSWDAEWPSPSNMLWTHRFPSAWLRFWSLMERKGREWSKGFCSWEKDQRHCWESILAQLFLAKQVWLTLLWVEVFSTVKAEVL